MLAHDVRDLGRYALAFIKKSGNSNGIKEFLRHVDRSELHWSEECFDIMYKDFFTPYIPRFQANSNHANIGQQQYNQNRRDIHVDTHWDFWDCLLLQCWLNSLFGGRSHTTVNNITNFNYGSNNTSSTNKTKESEDSRKLLAAGLAVAIVVVIFHVSICYWYHHSKKMARKSDKMDYLDNKLKIFRNIEFLSAFVSLAGLIACAVYPVLPIWGLVALGVHSSMCFLGGLAFHMKHEKESEDIDAAKKAAASYLSPEQQFTHNNSPPPSAPTFCPESHQNTFAHNNSTGTAPPPYPGDQDSPPLYQFTDVHTQGRQQQKS